MSKPQNAVSNVDPSPDTVRNTEMKDKKEEINDCFYFLTSGCSKGDQCKFRHKEEIKQVNMLCQRFLHGGCYNPDCNFIHLTILPSLAPQKPHPKPQVPVKECVFFKKGTCKNGDKCPFLHTTKKDPDNASLLSQFQNLLQIYGDSLLGNQQTKRERPSNEKAKRLRVYSGEEGDTLGFGQPKNDDFALRANRAKKFSKQVIQMHSKKKDDSLDFVVHSREELLAMKAEEEKKAEEAKKKVEQTVSIAVENNINEDVIDDEFKEDFEEMDRLLGEN